MNQPARLQSATYLRTGGFIREAALLESFIHEASRLSIEPEELLQRADLLQNRIFLVAESLIAVNSVMHKPVGLFTSRHNAEALTDKLADARQYATRLSDQYGYANAAEPRQSIYVKDLVLEELLSWMSVSL